MESKEPVSHTRGTLFRRVSRLFFKILLGVFILLLLVIVLVQTPYVQNIVRGKAESYLSKKLKTKVAIGKLYIGFPQSIELGNIYIEDLQKDTLLAGRSLKVNLDMWKLLHSDIAVNSIDLEGITAKIKRQLPDTTFNFQFIADAFGGKDSSTPAKTDTAAMKLSLDKLTLNKIRLVYNDVVTGNDMEVWIEHSNTKFDKLDPTHMQFGISLVEMKGIRARIYQNKPIQPPTAIPAADLKKDSSSPMQLVLKTIDLSDIALDYRNNISALYSNIALGELKGDVKTFDMAKQLIVVNELQLNKTTAAVVIGKPVTAEVVNKKVAVVVDSASAGWRMQVGKLALNNNTINYDDDSKPKLSSGMDFSHIHASALSFGITDLLYSKDSIAGNITKGEMKDQSGFVLSSFHTNFLYAANQAYLKDLSLRTPGTSIQRTIALQYPSLIAIQKDPAKMHIDADLQNTNIQVKDILLFMPSLKKQPLFKNPATVLHLNTRVQGTLARLEIPHFQFSGIGSTTVDIAGTVLNAADSNKIHADLTFNKIHTTRKDILALLPPNTLPANINVPDQITLTGMFNGGMNDLITNLSLQSSLGNIAVKGKASKFKDKRNALYDLVINLVKVDLGKLMKDTTLGPVTARLAAKGRGYDPQVANARVNALVKSAVYNKYPYRNFSLNGNIANRQLKALAVMRDPNVSFSLDANASFATKFPAMKLDMQIDTIFTQPLHLTADTVFYRGNLAADFASTNPDSLMGNMLLTKSVLTKNALRIPMDTIQVAAGKTDSGQFVRLNSDFVTLRLNGEYKLTQMGSVLQHAIEPYFSTTPDSAVAKTAPYDFTVDGTIINAPLLKVFAPQLDSLKPVTLQSRFKSDSGWNAVLTAPLIINGTNTINNLQLKASTGDNQLKVNAAFANIKSGASLNVYQTDLNATIADNKINFDLLNKDKAAKNKYRIAGLLVQPKKGEYDLSLKPDSLMLNYDKWTVNADNKIAYDSNGINITKFELGKDNQLLTINSTSPAPDAPIDINFKDFKLGTLSAFVKPDTLFIDGTLQGKAELSDVMTNPTFTTDLSVNNLAMYADTLGDLNLKVNNTQANVFAANVTLTGHGNDVQITGNYNVKPDNASDFNLTADIRQISLQTLEGASNKAITDASGTISGKLDVTGTAAKPQVNGDVNFNKARFNLGMLNSYFTIDKDKIAFNEQGIHFDNFTILDSANNKAVLDGDALTADFQHYKFDLTMKAHDFHALNTVKKKGQLYYGQLYFTTNLGIKGTEKAPVIDGSLTVNDKTKLTLVLPQREPGIEEREGIVKFVNMNAPPTDFVFEKALDTLNQSSAIGMDVAVNIEIKKEAELNIIVDEGNGDFLNVRGEALLSAAIDPGGKITLTGTYEIENGSYDLTFNLLKRKFDIQKGSKITFKGEPTDADVDLTAVYIANTAPLDLVKDQLEGSVTTIRNTYLQKLPFEVDLKMQGELLKPVITFDILLPDNKNYNVSKNIVDLVNEKLSEVRKEPSELNKQVFALLLLGRFVTENPFESSGPGATPESIARQSVSKLLTEQLNQLAASLVKGVNLNFDVQSQDDYSTGTREERTDLNVALSKKLLNDRLTVTVGSNFELEGAQNSPQQSSNIAGNVALDYQLSKDGRYLLRGYRKNDYQGVLEGYIIETGIGFIITVDYNKFREIFRSEKTKERLRAERKARQLQRAATKDDTKTTSK